MKSDGAQNFEVPGHVVSRRSMESRPESGIESDYDPGEEYDSVLGVENDHNPGEEYDPAPGMASDYDPGEDIHIPGVKNDLALKNKE